MDKKEYRLLLKDPRWISKRLEILERDNHTCSVCGCEDNLQVHHRVYEELAPWEYKDEDLVTICDGCHKEEHIKNGNTYRSYIENYSMPTVYVDSESGEIINSRSQIQVTTSEKILSEVEDCKSEKENYFFRSIDYLVKDISRIIKIQNSGRIKVDTTVIGDFEATMYVNIFFKKKLYIPEKSKKVVDKKLTKKQITKQTSDAYFAALKEKRKAYADKVKAEKEAKKKLK